MLEIGVSRKKRGILESCAATSLLMRPFRRLI